MDQMRELSLEECRTVVGGSWWNDAIQWLKRRLGIDQIEAALG